MLKQTKVIDKLSKLNDSNFKLVSELINSLETIETRIKTGKALSYNHRLNYDDKYKWGRSTSFMKKTKMQSRPQS